MNLKRKQNKIAIQLIKHCKCCSCIELYVLEGTRSTWWESYVCFFYIYIFYLFLIVYQWIYFILQFHFVSFFTSFEWSDSKETCCLNRTLNQPPNASFLKLAGINTIKIVLGCGSIEKQVRLVLVRDTAVYWLSVWEWIWEDGHELPRVSIDPVKFIPEFCITLAFTDYFHLSLS